MTPIVRRRLAVVLLIVAAASPPAHADTVVIIPVKDNTIFSLTTNSNGAGDSVFSGRTGAGGIIQRALLQFDVAAEVPEGATITSALFFLTVTRTTSGPRTHALHRVLADWGEGLSEAGGGSGAPATKDDATWEHRFFPTEFWDAEGGDFDPTPSGQQSVSTGTIVWPATPEMIADIQSWLDFPELNYGWMLRGDEEFLQTAKRIASREHPVEDIRPRLLIQYEAPCLGDLDGNGRVGFEDLLAVLAAHGMCDDCPEDLNGDGVVNFGDVLIILGVWGDCD